MSETVAINPKRLQWCIDDFGQELRELVSALNISEKTLTATLRGEPALSFRQLRHLAAHFGRGVLFFLGPDTVDEQIHTPQFRTIRNKLPQISPEIRKLVERAEWQREIFVTLVEERGEEPAELPVLPEFPGSSPREAAVEARKWLELDGRQTVETYRDSLEQRGVLVFRAQGYEGKWHWGKESPLMGFSLYFPQFPVVVLKREAWETQQAFTMMHELGHLILHRVGSIDGQDDFLSHETREVEANQFAGHLLVPDAYLTQITGSLPLDPSRYEQWVAPVSKLCGVSAEVVLRRLLDTGRIQPADYNAYRNWRSSIPAPESEPGGNRTFRHREPLHIFGQGYVQTVLDALNERRITLPKASSYLDNLKVEDLHSLERHVATL